MSTPDRSRRPTPIDVAMVRTGGRTMRFVATIVGGECVRARMSVVGPGRPRAAGIHVSVSLAEAPLSYGLGQARSLPTTGIGRTDVCPRGQAVMLSRRDKRRGTGTRMNGPACACAPCRVSSPAPPARTGSASPGLSRTVRHLRAPGVADPAACRRSASRES